MKPTWLVVTPDLIEAAELARLSPEDERHEAEDGTVLPVASDASPGQARV